MTRKTLTLFDPVLVRPALLDAFKKLDPRVQWRNPVMFVVYVGSAFTSALALAQPGVFTATVAVWLWFTVLFANFAEALALPLPAAISHSAIALQSGLVLLVIALAAFALVDVPLQRKLHLDRLKMSHQEVKEEHKQAEGDPLVKARLRSLARDRSRRRMIASASKASLVIANPTHYAVALRYRRDENPAPLVLAKGADAIALKIRAVAEQNNIPVIENRALARALYEAVQVDQVIPGEFFRPVAEIIYFLQSQQSPRAEKVH